MVWLLTAELAWPVDLHYTPIAPNDGVVDIRHAGDGSDRLFLVQQEGRVFIWRDGAVEAQPFLDIRARVRDSGNEQGLLSLAFDPAHAQNGRVYAWYTNLAGDMVLARFTLGGDPDQVDVSTEQVLLTVAQPFSNHNGGRVLFGPDGMLYLSIGDGGGSGDPTNAGQSLNTLLGKIIRIDVSAGEGAYAIPPDNPFVQNDGARDEIWAWGLRNPWRMAFDALAGDLYIADVGQNAVEEVNVQDAGSGGGENYGWNRMEGDQCFQSASCDMEELTLPVSVYGHDVGCSVTGGEVYRGERYPALAGVYLFGDFCSGRIWGLSRDGDEWITDLLDDTAFNIVTFGSDESGELYLSSGQDVYRISDGPFVEPGFEMNAGLNDAWVNPDAPFQGLFVTVFPELGLVFIAWFTFDSVPASGGEAVFGAADQRWVTALGAIEGHRAVLEAELTSGGVFNDSDPLATQQPSYGMITLEFEDCSSGAVSYDFPGPGLSGAFTIERPLDSNVALCEALSAD